jgi:hypothetical protein
MTPEEVEAAAANSPEIRAAAAEGTQCESKPKLRDRAYCYLQSDAETSIWVWHGRLARLPLPRKSP